MTAWRVRVPDDVQYRDANVHLEKLVRINKTFISLMHASVHTSVYISSRPIMMTTRLSVSWVRKVGGLARVIQLRLKALDVPCILCDSCHQAPGIMLQLLLKPVVP